MVKNYASLHNHTEFSNLRLLDSINKVDKMIKRAVELNLSGLAITDHEVLSSHVQAIKEYKKILKEKNLTENDFKLILGDEIYLVPDVTMMRDHYAEYPHTYYHFVILAKDEIGYRQLKEISSIAWNNSYTQRGMERVPIDYKQLRDVTKGEPGHLIGSTACLAGYLPRMILQLVKAEQNEETPLEEIEMYKQQIHWFLTFCVDTFGKENFYLEVQPSNNIEQILVNEKIKVISAAYGIKKIFTTDSHYLTEEDRSIHKIYLNSKNGEREVDDFYATTYMMTQEQVYDYLKQTFSYEEFMQMVDNTKAIAAECEFYDLHKPQMIPELSVEEELYKLERKYAYKNYLFTSGRFQLEYPFFYHMYNSIHIQDRYWANVCIDGMYKKILNNDNIKDKAIYWKRLDDEAKELWLISDTLGLRMTSYYNTMKKIIQIVWDKGNSLVGPARGSATGFLSCYLLDITQLDPIVWKLPYWRHLTHTRPELPKQYWAV